MKTVQTYVVKIYLSGDVDVIKQTCREYCLRVGLCVTITETLFVYTGGEEFGVEIGLLNYPRFPKAQTDINDDAMELADKCRRATFQHSFLVVTPDKTIWDTIKEQ